MLCIDCKNRWFYVSLLISRFQFRLRGPVPCDGEDLSNDDNLGAWAQQVSLNRLCIDATTPNSTLSLAFPFLVYDVKMTQIVIYGK